MDDKGRRPARIDWHSSSSCQLSQPFSAAISFDSIRERCLLCFQMFAAEALLQKLTFMLPPSDLGWRGQNLEPQVVEIKADCQKCRPPLSRKSSSCTSCIFLELRPGPSFQRPSLFNWAVSNGRRHNMSSSEITKLQNRAVSGGLQAWAGRLGVNIAVNCIAVGVSLHCNSSGLHCNRSAPIVGSAFSTRWRQFRLQAVRLHLALW